MFETVNEYTGGLDLKSFTRHMDRSTFVSPYVSKKLEIVFFRPFYPILSSFL